MKNKFRCIISMFIFILSIFLIETNIHYTYAQTNTFEIRTASDLVYAMNLSKTSGHQNDTFILMNDITIDSETQNALDEDKISLSFSNSDYPFSGIFEGNNHTISNLYFSTSLSIRTDTGLFSYTDGAIIRNLIINNANLQADYRGGTVVGYAKNTLIENVTVKNSHVFVTAADNVLTVITDGGIRGGAIVGDAENSILYNCEGNNNFVNTNSTSGVAALSGKGLTLGGLVGISNGTLVEYSRVIGGRVSNYYDVAVGAVGGNVLYVGGIIGQMKNSSKLIDSFSTAELYYYCGTYVSVGAGNVGHIGGLTAKMDGATNEIIRSHYAGVATSRQYNAVLVVPIVQDNQNISGLVDVYDGGAVVNSYFKPSANPDVSMNVLGDTSSTSSYGPLSDSNYISKDYFQGQSYDFTGNVVRNTDYNNRHYNKWVIDYNNGYPVHGRSVSAAFNFPNASTVTIGSTELVSNNVSTTNPYNFAVQGYKPSETSIGIITVPNSGYQFNGWYRASDIYATTLEDGNNNFFVNIFNNNSVYSNTQNISVNDVLDNDLFVAKYKAKVTFHDVNGNIINESGVIDNNFEKYYEYLEKLPDVIPQTNISGAFIGWTTISNNSKGYSSITTPELNNIKNQNEFYVEGDEVTKPLSLYPVYTDFLSKIDLIFEGNELDSVDDVSRRTGVGHLEITNNNDNTVTLSVIGDSNNALPTGYRYLGWYNSDGYRVSRDMNYTLELDTLDLTTTNTFTARFEYQVDYYTRAFHQDNDAFGTPELFKTMWYRYNEPFVNIGSPGFMREYITHWGTGSASLDHGNTDDLTDAFSGNINTPITVYSHNYTTVTGNRTGYELSAYLDFPGSGNINPEQRNTGSYFRFVPVSNRYELEFWTFESSSTLTKRTYANNPMDTGTILSTTTYKTMAFVKAKVIFHKKDNTTEDVYRKYNSDVFMDNNTTVNYTYPFYNQNTSVATSTSDSPSQTILNSITMNASPSNASMQVNDYYFVGWISSSDVEVGSSEWDYIYDVSGDLYASSSIAKVLPYIVPSNLKVDEAMDLYPVYVKYNIITKTSLSSFTTNDVNLPTDPTYTLVQTTDGKAIVTIVPDTSTRIHNDQPDLYNLEYLYEENRNEIIDLDNNNEYTYEVLAGEEYIFVADYIPYILVYHTNTSTTLTVIKYEGDQIGDMPDPLFSVPSDYVFIGYAKDQTSNENYMFTSYTNYENEDLTIVKSSLLVDESMELYPVYVEVNITVNSNIDTYLNNNGISAASVYELNKSSIDTMNLNIKISKLNNYYFYGWYENYVDDSDLGDLVSNNLNYKLEDNYFSNKTYTAVYKRVYEIRYHKPDKTVYKTIYVKEEDNRTFVTTNNNVESVIDYEAYLEISNYLSQNEYLNQFNYINQSNVLTLWDDFKNTVINKDMDLYPSIYRVTALNGNNQSIDLTTNNNILTIANNQNYTTLTFINDYNYQTLTVHVDEIVYTSLSSSTNNAVNKMIKLYNSGSSNVIQSENTDINGDAIFNLYVDLQISKNNSSTKNSDDIFIFDIINTSTLDTNKVLIPSNTSVKVRLPYGSYSIVEEHDWAWRYRTLSQNITINNNSNSTLVLTNESLNNKWFDKNNYSNNEFKEEE